MRNAHIDRSLHAFTAAMLYCMVSIGAVNDVRAGASNGDLGVSAAVNTNCLVQAAGPGMSLDFAEYSSITENESIAETVDDAFNIRCIKGTTAEISLGNGLNGAHAVGTSRAMSNGAGSYLSYELYTTAGRTTVWNTTNTVEYDASSSAFSNIPVYATIPAGQDVGVGNYTDNVQVSVSF